jgi:signal transduction histidine kinase
LLSKWPIRNKLLVGLALLVVIVATLMWSGIHGLYAYRGLIRSLDRRFRELPLAAELSRRVSDLRVALSELRTLSARGERPAPETFPSAGMWIVREDFRQKLSDVKAAIEAYRARLPSADAEGTQLGDSQAERQVLQQIEACVARIDRAARDEDWVFDSVKVGHLAAEADHLQALSSEIPTLLHRTIESFAAEVRGQYRALLVVAWGTSVSTALMLALLGALFYKWIFRPLRVLVKGSRKVAGGNFDYRIAVDSRDEMHELAEAMNDMTARFRDVCAGLDQQVKERTRQVIRNEQLASVGFLAAGVAHEINNPLASIAMCAESLEGRVGGLLAHGNPDHAVVRDYLRMIQDEAFRCKGITERLLDFSRIGESRRQQTDLAELVEGVIDMVGHLGRYHEKRTEFFADGRVTALVNAQEIKQVVLNLLTNALDSLDPGGTVKVALGRRQGQAELVFADDGCGMTPDVLEHLFEPFFTRKRNGQGTGLGLSISYRIVADHGGQIVAASGGVGQGSEFRITLPLAESAKEKDHRYQAA